MYNREKSSEIQITLFIPIRKEESYAITTYESSCSCFSNSIPVFKELAIFVKMCNFAADCY